MSRSSSSRSSYQQEAAHNETDYHLFHAIRGELLLEPGRREQARAAELRALTLTENRAERSLLQRRLADL
jgi:predicted RNA polymerase sigma factor